MAEAGDDGTPTAEVMAAIRHVTCVQFEQTQRGAALLSPLASYPTSVLWNLRWVEVGMRGATPSPPHPRFRYGTVQRTCGKTTFTLLKP